jgi:hypothetical protein
LGLRIELFLRPRINALFQFWSLRIGVILPWDFWRPLG